MARCSFGGSKFPSWHRDSGSGDDDAVRERAFIDRCQAEATEPPSWNEDGAPIWCAAHKLALLKFHRRNKNISAAESKARARALVDIARAAGRISQADAAEKLAVAGDSREFADALDRAVRDGLVAVDDVSIYALDALQDHERLAALLDAEQPTTRDALVEQLDWTMNRVQEAINAGKDAGLVMSDSRGIRAA